MLGMGIDLEVTYIGEAGKNVTGQRIGFDLDNAFIYSADIDFGKLAGLTGFSVHALGVSKFGRNLSGDFLGDNLSASQEIFGATNAKAFRLVNLYAEQQFINGQISVAAGQLSMANDFAATTFSCVAVALTSECGVPRALANANGFTNGPNGAWGGRIRVRPIPDFYIQTGIYEAFGRSQAGGSAGFDWGFNKSTGVAVPLEIGWEPLLGRHNLSGHYKLGVVHDTSDYVDVFQNDLGQPIGITSTLPGHTHNGRDTFWIMADQMIYRNGPNANQGLILVASFAHSDADTQVNSNTAFLSVGDKGFIQGREQDIATVSASWFGISDKFHKLQTLNVANGLPVAGGSIGPQTSEFVFEANYSYLVYPGVILEPAVQYFVHPNADKKVKDALVFAGRLQINF
jgi:porin